ncbi:uncharacterized protein N7515_003850 [Penicillium bovifimosum]|uniref:Uncharacterized protein n=1 Tax=Penicillium bovifimosum TaxID=126998 RepID=A0A9W9L6M0_9EURO|nr:uncharacterized protein N7515_003850 [Penicillium bovifimosum]KAJ5139002.1 hypothetical protein N7515_003850 [Penicillium bovifimosum]
MSTPTPTCSSPLVSRISPTNSGMRTHVISKNGIEYYIIQKTRQRLELMKQLPVATCCELKLRELEAKQKERQKWMKENPGLPWPVAKRLHGLREIQEALATGLGRYPKESSDGDKAKHGSCIE